MTRKGAGTAAGNEPNGALTIDLEDWRCALHPQKVSDWRRRPKIDGEYVVSSARKLVAILNEHEAKATFFVLGEVASAVPDLITEIHKAGHEIASHSPVHLPPSCLVRHEFSELLARDLRLLEQLTGQRPQGFRTPYFAVTRRDGWLFDILSKHGILYDSSVVPTWTPYWGLPTAPKNAYRPDLNDISKPNAAGPILEIPISVWPMWTALPGLPIGGGFYMRAWPMKLLLAALNGNVKQGHRLVLYTHPGNIDTQKESVRTSSLRDRLSQYLVIKRGPASFMEVLRNFRFGTMSRVFAAELDGPPLRHP